jgi:hypothetical protein
MTLGLLPSLLKMQNQMIPKSNSTLMLGLLCG